MTSTAPTSKTPITFRISSTRLPTITQRLWRLLLGACWEYAWLMGVLLAGWAAYQAGWTVTAWVAIFSAYSVGSLTMWALERIRRPVVWEKTYGQVLEQNARLSQMARLHQTYASTLSEGAPIPPMWDESPTHGKLTSVRRTSRLPRASQRTRLNDY